MQSFLNSPPGPLGAAGQSSNTTMPQSIFSNAPAPLTGNLNQGLAARREEMPTMPGPSFQDQNPFATDQGGQDPQKFSETLKLLFGNLFGGQGQLAQQQPQNPLGQGGGSIAQMLGGGNGQQQVSPGTPGLPGAPGIPQQQGQGALTQFMGPNTGQV